MDRDIIMQALKLVIMVATLIVTRYVIPLLKAKTNGEKMEKLLKYIQEGVRAAEQIFDEDDGKTKKKYVMHFVRQLLEQMSISLTEEELELLVEAAVRTMNTEDCLMISSEEYDHVLDGTVEEKETSDTDE